MVPNTPGMKLPLINGIWIRQGQIEKENEDSFNDFL